MIIGTTSDHAVLCQMELARYFQYEVGVPYLTDSSQIKIVLKVFIGSYIVVSLLKSDEVMFEIYAHP